MVDPFMDWPFLAGALAVVSTVYLFFARSRISSFSTYLLYLNWTIYLWHQFEEHGYDFKGRRYHFRTFFCEALGFEMASCPASTAFIFFVNVCAVWMNNLFAIWLGPSQPIIGLACYSVHFVNVFAHVQPALATLTYNPGLFTAVFFFIPIPVLYARSLWQQRKIQTFHIVSAIFCGILLHAIMAISLNVAHMEMISESTLCVIQVVLGFVPTLGGALVASLSRSSTKEN
eukprot:TRINITY_DN1447_c0_g1_i1.p1 TRINITY_DN1447_c0_g1~~TRINITY_DN1447_c0_g1_i1.p1  ORF type:complete len:230 (-),score=42.03 TRINITY_DN1447_c0_g1_i1:67-756(-)